MGADAAAERVLSEMAQLGFRATELGAVGFLPDDTAEAKDVVESHGMSLIGGFVPLIAHDPKARAAASSKPSRSRSDSQQVVPRRSAVHHPSSSPRSSPMRTGPAVLPDDAGVARGRPDARCGR